MPRSSGTDHPGVSREAFVDALDWPGRRPRDTSAAVANGDNGDGLAVAVSGGADVLYELEPIIEDQFLDHEFDPEQTAVVLDVLAQEFATLDQVDAAALMDFIESATQVLRLTERWLRRHNAAPSGAARAFD